ncbi:hypothetical protein GOL30_12635 [Sinorhizobium medicae]|uniref:hypothetical protein n=1 Tax=Sinorhizobium medicae TaxID=110321 RepID=UPI000FD8525C|nr:hypothetical protein [Sinorhizobium medicae]MDX0429925.1 hypothetical protein [Sinorhizobium medicae]MDX0460603.1 hypothetical protein [Sinorhizobium medicae]MDX0533039.1 hypothetical protein [Sinorhizobium medicae]MDX0572649.1 hypothetical protein [Sinorhizobium medicae]MDX0600515.1 hypothetical protein [Sinorhizobium medicae]
MSNVVNVRRDGSELVEHEMQQAPAEQLTGALSELVAIAKECSPTTWQLKSMRRVGPHRRTWRFAVSLEALQTGRVSSILTRGNGLPCHKFQESW